ncbi:MAG TPA: phosphoribosyltransferase [Acidimicrobiales bacterium]|nr:phosphoribosyltransferase [Acidimicrobiales bacterium]
MALAPVLPVWLCPLPGPLYTVLLGYKEAPALEARTRFASIVRTLFADYLHAHASCLAAAAGGAPQIVLPVPSSLRPGGSPLAGVDGLAPAVEAALPGARWWPQLVVRTGAPIGHMHPSARAFAVAPPLHRTVAGRRVVLLDDTYVSGSRAQSTAASLRRAGARSVVIVVLGRVLRPDRVPAHADFLGALRRADALDDVARPCGRCVQTAAPTE